MSNDHERFPSLLARSALGRVGFALVLIVLTWAAIQWAVALP